MDGRGGCSREEVEKKSQIYGSKITIIYSQQLKGFETLRSLVHNQDRFKYR